MWKALVRFGKELFTLKRKVADNSSEIQEIRQELKDLAEFVRELNNIVNQERS